MMLRANGFRFVAPLIATMAFNLGGCGGPRIDASSDNALKQSLGALQEELSEGERAEFLAGIQAIRTDIKENRLRLSNGETVIDKQFRDTLDGMTVDQVISHGRRKRAYQREKIEKLFPNIRLPDPNE